MSTGVSVDNICAITLTGCVRVCVSVSLCIFACVCMCECACDPTIKRIVVCVLIKSALSHWQAACVCVCLCVCV